MWVTVEDVKSRYLGGEIPATDDELITLIGDAEDAALRAFPDLQALIDSEEIPEQRVRRIVARIVIRHVRNPEGYRSLNLTSGSFTDGYTFSGDNPGEITLTDQDKEDLVPGHGKQKAFTVDLLPERPEDDPSFGW